MKTFWTNGYKLRWAGASTLAFACLMAVNASTAHGQTVFAGEHYKIVARHSDKCLDVVGYGTHSRAQVHQWDCHGGENQQWQFRPTDNGFFRIIGRQSGKSLDVEGISLDDRAQVQIYEGNAGLNQQWRLVPTGGGFFRIEARHSRKAIDISEVSTANRARVQQFTNNGGLNQQFRLVQVSSPLSCNWGFPADYLLTGDPTFPVPIIQPNAIDNDVIRYSETRMRPAITNEIRIVLTTAPNVTWWKGIEVLDAENVVIARVETQDNNHGPVVAVIPPGHNPETMKLRFLKAKFLGIHTGMYTVCDLRRAVGKQLSFHWQQD